MRVLHIANTDVNAVTSDLQVSKYTPYARALGLSAVNLSTDLQQNTIVTFARADGKYEVWRVAPSGVVETKTVRDVPSGGFAPFATSPLGARDVAIGARAGSWLYQAVLQGGGALLSGIIYNNNSVTGGSSPVGCIPVGIATFASRRIISAWTDVERGGFILCDYNAQITGYESTTGFGLHPNLALFGISGGWGDEQTRVALLNQVNGAVTLYNMGVPDGRSRERPGIGQGNCGPDRLRAY